MKYMYFLIISFLFCQIIKKNDNTLYLYKESKRIIYKYKLCSLYIIYDQYFTSNNIKFVFDGDVAGIKAAMRGIDLVLEQDLNVKILLLLFLGTFKFLNIIYIILYI